MADDDYSFTFERASARAAFPRTGIDAVILALLAGIQPEEGWDGCVVYLGPSPGGESEGCVGTRGPCAESAQQRLVEACERMGIEVKQLYEGGPEPDATLARADGGRWVSD